MSQLNDAQYLALITQGFSGTHNKMMIDWAQANGATSDQYNTAMIESLQSKGLATSGNPNTAWREYVSFLGFSADQNGILDFWVDGGLGFIANDTFTNADIANIGLGYTSDSGHNWTAIAGTIAIVSNEADVNSASPGYYHYTLGLTGQSIQPSRITVDVKNTNATTQTVGVSLRDNEDDLNLVYCHMTVSSHTEVNLEQMGHHAFETFKNDVLSCKEENEV